MSGADTSGITQCSCVASTCWAMSIVRPDGLVIQCCIVGGNYYAVNYDIGIVARARNSSASGICSEITMCPLRNGSSVGAAAVQVYMYGGTSCYAICTSILMYASAYCLPSDRNLKTDIRQYRCSHY